MWHGDAKLIRCNSFSSKCCACLAGPSPMRSPPTGTWTKITRKHCANTMYGSSFSTLTAAQVFCLQQGPSICSGVYDDRCDSQSSFYACKVGGFDSSSIGSCIYIAATKDEFIRVKDCALCCMLACMCTQLDTRTRVLLAIGLGNGVGRGCICSKRYRAII